MKKPKLIYCICNKIINTWIEDFVDEDTYEVVSITRHDYEPFQYVTAITIPVSKSLLDTNDIKDLCRLYIKMNNKNIRFDSIVSERKYNGLRSKITKDKFNNKPCKYKCL